MTPHDLRPADPAETPLSPAEVMHGLNKGLIKPGPVATRALAVVTERVDLGRNYPIEASRMFLQPIEVVNFGEMA